nr:PREDICTED: uncharacterized protein LOC107398865 isoform X3 [Tribolium castaneum]|eukprot:XP_015839900.1 PREDICTED: uncharacterized protein LOC107398865 isoform X3 [Tribolium castaneum]
MIQPVSDIVFLKTSICAILGYKILVVRNYPLYQQQSFTTSLCVIYILKSITGYLVRRGGYGRTPFQACNYLMSNRPRQVHLQPQEKKFLLLLIFQRNLQMVESGMGYYKL